MSIINKEISIKNITKKAVEGYPDLPFRGIFQGGSGQGKTNSIVNFVNYYKSLGLFDHIYVICPTRDLKLISLVEDKNDFYLEPTFQTTQIIQDRIADNVKRYKKYLKDKEFYDSIKHKDPDSLTLTEIARLDKMESVPPVAPYKAFPQSVLIVDDSIGSVLFSPSKRNPFVNFFIRSRHQGCSIILSTQHWGGLNRSLRANATFFVIFKMNDKKQLYQIYLELAHKMDFEQFLEVFHRATEEKYSFLFVDLEKDIVRRNFNEPIDISINTDYLGKIKENNTEPIE